MPQQTAASIDPAWYGVILTAIIGILSLIYQAGVGGTGGFFKAETLFHDILKTTAVYISISLITLTSCNPLPNTSEGSKITLFFIILACTSLLSAAVRSRLWWVPHLSLIRPLFELLRDLYLFYNNTGYDIFWNLYAISTGMAKQIIERFLQTIRNPEPSSAQASSSTANTGQV